MTSEFETIFSRARGKMTDLKEIMSLSTTDLAEINLERLYSVLGDPRVAYLFDTLSVDEDMEEMTYTLKNSANDFVDQLFVNNLLADGMVISWLRPQVESHEYTSLMIGGKEEKSLNNKYKEVVNRLDKLEVNFKKAIRDRGYMYNSYIVDET